MIGGGASRLNGTDHYTKVCNCLINLFQLHTRPRIPRDLDIDVKSLKFLTKLDPANFYTRAGSSTGRLTTTFMLNPNDHIKCDIAANSNIEMLQPFTKLNHDGIRYSSPTLLLACKIRTYGVRAMGNNEKRESDLHNILSMVDKMGKAPS